jgi:hypothetical protein
MSCCRRPCTALIDEQPAIPEGDATDLITSAPIGLLNCRLDVIKEIAVRPTEAGEVVPHPLPAIHTIEAGSELRCAPVPNTERVFVLFSNHDAIGAFFAAVFLTSADHSCRIDGRGIIIAGTVVAHHITAFRTVNP